MKEKDNRAKPFFVEAMSEGRTVWRAIFMALGLNAMLLGGEFFVFQGFWPPPGYLGPSAAEGRVRRSVRWSGWDAEGRGDS